MLQAPRQLTLYDLRIQFSSLNLASRRILITHLSQSEIASFQDKDVTDNDANIEFASYTNKPECPGRQSFAVLILVAGYPQGVTMLIMIAATLASS